MAPCRSVTLGSIAESMPLKVMNSWAVGLVISALPMMTGAAPVTPSIVLSLAVSAR